MFACFQRISIFFLGLRGNSGEYYFYFSNSSLSSSSFPFLHLSYCEHQQSTSYSSSGFSILYSSVRLPLTDIEDKKHSSSFDHNAVLFAVHPSLSPTTLVSSTNQKQKLGQKTDHRISTTVMSAVSNVTSLPTSIQKGNETFHLILPIGFIIVGIVVLMIIYWIVKRCNRNEGTYKIDESNHFPIKNPRPNSQNGKVSSSSSSTHHNQKFIPTVDQKLANSKEWYV